MTAHSEPPSHDKRRPEKRKPDKRKPAEHPHDSHAPALAQYRRRAPYYDLELALFEPARRIAIERLAMKPGDVVIDVGCGTGLSFALLLDVIGAEGQIIGIEQSPDMLQRARKRVQEHGWANVALIQGAAEDADIAAATRRTPDVALFHFTHDILREPLAVANVVRQIKPGGRVVACGLQWADLWAWPLNIFVLGAALHSVSSLRGLDRPWSLLEDHIESLQVDSIVAGAIYVASGAVKA
jgi:ubiquinone/menaquinone biosynthesis C-methylase UbiE